MSRERHFGVYWRFFSRILWIFLGLGFWGCAATSVRYCRGGAHDVAYRCGSDADENVAVDEAAPEDGGPR